MIDLLNNRYNRRVTEEPSAAPDFHPAGLLRHPTYALGKLHKAVHTKLDTPLREHWVLTYLAERAEVSQQEVANTMEIDRSEVVRLIDSLEKAGLVTRTRDPEDRRKYRLAITAAGNRLREETDAKIFEATDVLLARLTPAERETLHRLSLKALGYEAGES
ncbi:MarR family transcriptional regulator [Nocardia seriolae]|nr:MarR family transcriptional regulator [Nocardia seriolae]MTJ70933.1 MarR family transcriptional regulator [Nocardia seriolae]MTJ89724.1 MarR family transcriptional regulator [Nocardia seriolae]MTK33699.1 MarR family transcriptional regulator [Nocardia seriolae]MTK42852.1 MarR family transcriptional regulator [Nocardia seriolae]